MFLFVPCTKICEKVIRLIELEWKLHGLILFVEVWKLEMKKFMCRG